MFGGDAQLRQVQHRQVFGHVQVFVLYPVYNHADGTGVVGDGVYQDERACRLVLLIGVEEEFLCRSQHHAGYLVELHRQGFPGQLAVVDGKVLHRVHIHFVLDAVDACTAEVRGLLDEERLAGIHRLLVHPHQHRFKVAVHHRQVVRVYQHLSARHVNLVFQGKRHRLGRESVVQLAVVGNDALDVRLLAGGQRHHLVPLAHDAGSHLAAEATEIEVGTQHILHRETEIGKIMVVVYVYRLQEIQQGDALVPRRALRLLHHIVAIQCRKRNAVHIGNAQRSNKLPVLAHNLVEALFRKVHQVHLVDGKHDVLDAQQRHQEGVAACLRDDTRPRIHQDDGKVGGRATGNHVARVLLVPRSVGNDKLTVVGREVAVSHINGDTLLALCLQAIQQQRIVYVVARIAHPLAVALQCVQLVFIQFLAVEQQTAYQRGFTVVHRTGGQQSQQIFLFILIQKSLYIKS